MFLVLWDKRANDAIIVSHDCGEPKRLKIAISNCLNTPLGAGTWIMPSCWLWLVIGHHIPYNSGFITVSNP